MIDALVGIALEAGQAIMASYAAPDFEARAKDDGSPVTAADAAAEKIILAKLAALYPDIPIVAEEEAAAGRIPECEARLFLVDPLDGTKEFINRKGDFTVNIALIDNHAPVTGVVYAPALGLIYAGDRESGARAGKVVDGKVAEWCPITTRTPGATLDVVASRSHMSPETVQFVERYPSTNLVNAGSSLKFCRVAAAEADLYPRLGRTMEWDTAAGDAVLRAAGGSVRTLDGKLLTYGKRRQADDVDFANPWFVAAGSFDPFALAAKA